MKRAWSLMNLGNISLSARACFYLTLITSAILLLPSLIFQNTFAQGDHGRDLYIFSMVAEGGALYRELWWQYGPLMPAYFALFLKFGQDMASVLLADTLLRLACGLAFFGIMVRATSPVWSYLSSIFFLGFFPFFFHTYTYTGGILLVLLIILMLLRYLQTAKTAYVYAGYGLIFLLCLVKFNIGLGMWLGFLIGVALINRLLDASVRQRNGIFSGVIGLVTPLAALSIYFFMTAGLPQEILSQCFNYAKSGSRQISVALWEIPAITIDILREFFSSSPSKFLFAILAALTIAFFAFWHKRLDPSDKRSTLCLYIILGITSICLLQEFFISGVDYRGLWAGPALLLMVLILAGKMLLIMPIFLRLLFVLLLATAIVSQHYEKRFSEFIPAAQAPRHFLDHPRGGIIIGNEPEWIETVEKTVAFLETVLAKEEYFFALPYEPLYYYLLDRASPTYHYCIFDFVGITPRQEREMIQALKEKRVNWVIYSNRVISGEPGLGVFGQTHSRLLAAYLNENFEQVAEFGYWDRESGYNEDHGIRIMRRKSAPKDGF